MNILSRFINMLKKIKKPEENENLLFEKQCISDFYVIHESFSDN